MKTFDGCQFDTDRREDIYLLRISVREWCNSNNISSDEEFIFKYAENTHNQYPDGQYTTTLYNLLQELKECWAEAV